ncbi:SGNH/GDSL hydrolase family protein [Butyrivibrio sp. CB08]|uniref:SGNH/GDSL hydrolase family protein n=1 Tax=Butyrivibrio sp. CB08 TaxID=2364879 RepID=UPI0013140A5B|nr:SGNH/GDSL hydrolase family protein [Butyrivibrio sp. CB08]
MVFSAAGRDRNAYENMEAGTLSSKEVVDSMASTIDSAAVACVSALEGETPETVTVSNEENTTFLERTLFTVTRYETPVTMYTSDTVNVRSGAGTDYDKIGKLKWGTETTVMGETDNGWYEVAYNDATAFIIGDFMVTELPSIPMLFVGDSRTVQMKMAVGSTDKEYIAKIGEGYNWFKNTALSEIPHYAGSGTSLIINFGVNDLGNASKYIKLVNSNVDAWTEAGITVYYAAVTPVGEGASVTNAQIEQFNSRLQSELDPRVIWIDGYSYLSQTGFSAPDGLHYSADTYRNLYSYYISVLSQA